MFFKDVFLLEKPKKTHFKNEAKKSVSKLKFDACAVVA